MAEPVIPEDIWSLRPHEHYWIEKQPFLLSRGYLLRPRYHPGLVPPWKLYEPDAPLSATHRHGDAFPCLFEKIVDAIRVKDDVQVVLRRTWTGNQELSVLRSLSSDEARKSPDNRTVPLLDVISLPDDEEVLIVMPLLRQFHSPVFRDMGEICEAIIQFIQGLEFMHKRNIAHGDACFYNMMMDASEVIPDGWHFTAPRTDASGDYEFHFKWRARALGFPVDYYFIDFGLSRFFPEGPKLARAVGVFGQDRTVPELSATVPYNPFKVDIYQLGNVFIRLTEKYPQARARFGPLFEDMTNPDPDARPTASRAFDNTCRKTRRTGVWMSSSMSWF
ncbi:Protein kinase domain-containing protein [Mycena kentingensis (nom. inval.)]|nr:Protein kinase domain-containing protein [Mycena kentingensis (nom. inval.)]